MSSSCIMATRLNLNFLFRSRQEADKKAKTRIIYFDHNMSTALCVGIVLALLSFRGTLAEQDCQTNLSAGGTVTINCRGLGITSFPNTGNATTVKILEANLTEMDFENTNLSTHVEVLQIMHSEMRKVRKFKPNGNLLSLSLEDNKIKEITDGAFDGFHKLKSLYLNRNQLKAFPVFNLKDSKLEELNVDENEIAKLELGSLEYLPSLRKLSMKKNRFTIIPNHFFNLTKKTSMIKELDFTDTPIRLIEEDAFVGLVNLENLTLDGTDIDHLPTKGLQNLAYLSLRNVRRFNTIPTSLGKIKEIHLAEDKSFLCCKFKYELIKDEFRPKTFSPLNDTRVPSTTPNTPISTEPITTATDNQSIITIPPGFKGRKKRQIEVVPPEPFNSSKPFLQPSTEPVVCTPTPTPFQPCQDIMGAKWLLGISFVVAPFALCGNFLVIVVLLCSRRHYNVSRFLVTNLAVADMCLGIYLFSLVVESVITSGEYYNHVERFQHGLSCKVLGFLAIFSSELSVFSLTLITIERYLTIVYAMYPKQRLVMKNAVIAMGIGWTVSFVIAVLPIFGISSYRKVAICLPFDIDNGGKWYLLFVFCINAISFLLITALYAGIYRSVFLPKNATATSGHDTRVARRMAVLVFTDFACFAPIAITGLSAMFGNTLIGVEESKYLLVFFFPLNSFMNPFLYALITKSFRRDLATLLKSCFVCGGALTEYLTTLNNRSLQSNNDHLSRTRQSIDFNTVDTIGSAGNNLQILKENAIINVAYSKSEPELVRFNNLSLQSLESLKDI